ncbi:MAG: hypothetical protein LBP92_02065 [Deltaproteobacteria bacterium]|jgi:glutamine cyclotransferase|nr:hypothetical protein [Deltaproteobacteria bacterium]
MSRHFRIKKWLTIWFTLFILVFAIFLTLHFIDLTPKLAVEWKSLGHIPGHDQKVTPQGLEYIDGHLILSVSVNNKENVIYGLSLSDDSYVIDSMFVMPYEAVHTSGLAWDGQVLWAIDYMSDAIYRIDLEKSFETGRAAVTGRVATGLSGSSSITFCRINGKSYLAVSDFMNSGYTYLVEADKILTPTPVEDKAAHKYKNRFFSQGLMWDGTYLYEANGDLGHDTIYQIDLQNALHSKDMKSSVVRKYRAPSRMVEDLATNGSLVWTTDEETLQIYQSTFPFPPPISPRNGDKTIH